MRSEANTSAILGGKKFKVPVVPANMKAVIDESLAESVVSKIIFISCIDSGFALLSFAKRAKNWKTVSISVGVKQKTFKMLKLLGLTLEKEVDFVTIDIAHGHSFLVKSMIEHIKNELPQSFIIAGNVATVNAVDDLAEWGADCVKVGIGQGNVCTTKDKTGFTMPMFSCVLDCADSQSKIPIIADGGLRCNGDIAKAIAAGATLYGWLDFYWMYR